MQTSKVIRKGTRHVVNRAATALRLAATTLLRSQSYLGAQYRRLRARLGAPKAITAMAHKLARLVYRMLKVRSACCSLKYCFTCDDSYSTWRLGWTPSVMTRVR